ncbi:hypothetical protein AAVH_15952 [Aphelenchoides avenae]|nr:hypothetical protein AAVH_15952 [Aphelenchus avenae]
MNAIKSTVVTLVTRNSRTSVPLFRKYGVGNPFLDNIKRAPQDLKNQFKAKGNLVDQNLTKAMMEAEDRRDASHQLSLYYTSRTNDRERDIEVKGKTAKNAPKSKRGPNSV